MRRSRRRVEIAVRPDDGLTVYRGLSEVPDDFGPSAVTIGVFDGVHRGHQALIRDVVARAHALDVVPVVATFDRHPLEVIAPEKAPQLLSTVPQRARIIASLGIQALVVMTFDDVFRHLTPEEFVRTILVDDLHARHIVVGANFTFGHKRAGTIDVLEHLGAEHGFGVTVFQMQPGATADVVSSTLIRRHLEAGDVERASQDMDHPYVLEGLVEAGAGRGDGLGFPTANLRIPSKMLLPRTGVYAGWLTIDDVRHPAAINVGVNPTFEERRAPIVEVHVIGFRGDLYGRIVEVEFTHRLRDERKFDSVDALIKQMGDDVERARAVLGVNPS